MEEPEPRPLILSPSNSLRRRSSDSKSPEFEFWMVQNPSFPQPNLLSADELFSDGFLLPLHLLNQHHDPPEPSGSDLTQKPEVSTIDSSYLSDASTLTFSKRWKGIFRKSGNNNNSNIYADDQKGTNVKKKEKKKKTNVVSGGVGGVSVAELNINIWPFSRSRSAGNGGTRPRSTAVVSRKVSSAPCSRSNSAGESKTRKWPASPSRGGVHLGRNSPVWQVRRPSGGARNAEGVIKSGEKGMKKDGNESHRKIPPAGRGGGGSRARVLSLNVPMCIGYRNHLSCKSDENSAVSITAVAASGGGVSVEGVRGRTFEQNKQRHVPEGLGPVTQKLTGYTILAGLLGFGLADIAYADKNEAADNTFPPTESDIVPPPIGFGETPLSPESTKTVPSPESPPASSNEDLEETAKKEKLRLEALLRSKGVRYGSFPRFTVSVKGRKLTIKFKVPPSCEIPILITSLVSRLGVNADYGVGLDMMVQAWDSGVAWQLALSRPKTHKESVGGQVQAKDKIGNDGELCILMFRPLISSDYAEIEFMKEGSFTSEEMDALVSVLQLSGQPRSLESRPRGDVARVPTTDKTIANLEAMGVKIYGLKQTNDEQPKADISWDNIAGYDQQKREIEDTILLALKSPEVYDDIACGTRCKFETNRPRAVLFEGPPGTGKTSCARVIANEAGVPLLYVPLEVIMSKYYGESERMLGKVFSLADEITSGTIVFLDEVDSVATARDSETHEATRRLLSVLLRQIDGFEQEKKVVVIAATNRKQDLDPALLSRFDCMITFGLPDQQTREEIAAQYAKHLTKSELTELASATEEMSGRDIRDVCEQAERHWASKVIRGKVQKEKDQGSSLPPLKEYIESALKRRTSMDGLASFDRNPSPILSKKSQLDFMNYEDIISHM